MITLECLEGPSKGQHFEFSSDTVVLGRSFECDLSVDDRTCSRKHAKVFERDGKFFVADLGSTNGIRLNGKQVEEGILCTGDRFSFGKSAFRFIGPKQTCQEDSDLALDDMIEKTITLSAAESKLFSLAKTASNTDSASGEELAALRRANRQLEAIYSLNHELEGTFSLAGLYEIVTRNILSQFDAVERVCIFVTDRRTGLFQQVASNRKDGVAEDSVSRSVLDRVRQTAAGILAMDVQSDQRFADSATLFDCNVRSFMCVPLNTRENTIGAVYVENKTRPACFEDSDLELLTVFGKHIAAAVESASLYEELERSFYETVKSLLAALEAKDEYTRGHSDRVALYAVGIAETLELPREKLNNLKTAAELHDIGKIAVPESIINSASRLTDEEFECIKQHPDFGVRILRPIRFLADVLPIVRHHHERYDGTGYPEGLSGERIPLEARILNLADAFDAMTTTRSYNKPISFDQALERCREESSISFDPSCVDALCRFIGERLGEQAGTGQTPAVPGGVKRAREDTGTFDPQALLQEISKRAELTP